MPGPATPTTTQPSNPPVTNVVLPKAPAKVTGLSKKNAKKNKVTIRWKKQASGISYEIYRYHAKKGKYQLYKRTKKNSILIKNLKKKTTYRFRIRAYRYANGKKLVGRYSNVLKVKITK